LPYICYNEDRKLLSRKELAMAGTTRVRKEKKFGLEEHRDLLCKNCKNRITSPDKTVTVDGEHVHTFTNPEGVTYRIGCYASAGGCIITGLPTFEDTWFEEFCWDFALCSSCFTHLGWYYLGESESFFGLTLDRLTTKR
jgi:hypothetical protein